MQTQKSLLSQRGQMFLIAFPFWVLLAFWSISAFWQHVDSTSPTYLWAARLGACSAEFAVLAMVFLHCFSKHINVRKWALVLGTALVVAVVAHTAGLRGLDEATAKQAEADRRLREELTKMSEKQMQHTKRKADVAKSAQKELADTVRAGNDKVKDSSIFPRWYLDGWMYGVLFALSALALAVPLGMMGNRLDVDTNFDGIPDHQQWLTDRDAAREQLNQKALEAQHQARALIDEFRETEIEVRPTGRLDEPTGKVRRR